MAHFSRPAIYLGTNSSSCRPASLRVKQSMEAKIISIKRYFPMEEEPPPIFFDAYQLFTWSNGTKPLFHLVHLNSLQIWDSVLQNIKTTSKNLLSKKQWEFKRNLSNYFPTIGKRSHLKKFCEISIGLPTTFCFSDTYSIRFSDNIQVYSTEV